MKASLELYEKHRDEINPEIVAMFDVLGTEGVEAYGSGHLFHNTHSILLPGILQEGLHAEAIGIDEDEVDFARDLVQREGNYNLTSYTFESLVAGQSRGRQRGVYFDERSAEDSTNYNIYGMPERVDILMKEMCYASRQDHFGAADRERAKAIFEKYYERFFVPEAEIVVLEANPFDGDIINYRLDPRDPEHILRQGDKEAKFILAHLQSGWGGLYVPGPIAPESLEVVATLPFELEQREERLAKYQNTHFF